MVKDTDQIRFLLIFFPLKVSNLNQEMDVFGKFFSVARKLKIKNGILSIATQMKKQNDVAIMNVVR